MIDDLFPFFTHAALTAIGAYVGVQSQRMSDDWKTGIKRVFHRILSVILWPLHWGVTAIKEWHRVSTYRHRRITWDDLSQKSKSAVQLQDLSEEARASISWDDLPQDQKSNVQLQDLSEEARASIKVKDLPRGEKHTIIDKFILPQLHNLQHRGTLTILNDGNSVALSETADVAVPLESGYRDVRQDGMQMSLIVEFTNPGAEVPLRTGEHIVFDSGPLAIGGSIRTRNRDSLALHQNSEFWCKATFQRPMQVSCC